MIFKNIWVTIKPVFLFVVVIEFLVKLSPFFFEEEPPGQRSGRRCRLQACSTAQPSAGICCSLKEGVFFFAALIAVKYLEVNLGVVGPGQKPIYPMRTASLCQDSI